MQTRDGVCTPRSTCRVSSDTAPPATSVVSFPPLQLLLPPPSQLHRFHRLAGIRFCWLLLELPSCMHMQTRHICSCSSSVGLEIPSPSVPLSFRSLRADLLLERIGLYTPSRNLIRAEVIIIFTEFLRSAPQLCTFIAKLTKALAGGLFYTLPRPVI